MPASKGIAVQFASSNYSPFLAFFLAALAEMFILCLLARINTIIAFYSIALVNNSIILRFMHFTFLYYYIVFITPHQNYAIELADNRSVSEVYRLDPALSARFLPVPEAWEKGFPPFPCLGKRPLFSQSMHLACSERENRLHHTSFSVSYSPGARLLKTGRNIHFFCYSL